MQVIPTFPPVTLDELFGVHAPLAPTPVRPLGDEPREQLRRDDDRSQRAPRALEVMVERAHQDRRRQERRIRNVPVSVDTRAPLPRRTARRRSYDPVFSVSLFA